MILKECRQCGMKKEETEFRLLRGARKTEKRGTQNVCRRCENANRRFKKLHDMYLETGEVPADKQDFYHGFIQFHVVRYKDNPDMSMPGFLKEIVGAQVTPRRVSDDMMYLAMAKPASITATPIPMDEVLPDKIANTSEDIKGIYNALFIENDYTKAVSILQEIEFRVEEQGMVLSSEDEAGLEYIDSITWDVPEMAEDDNINTLHSILSYLI